MEDTPNHEEVSPNVLKEALKTQSDFQRDVSILAMKIDASIFEIRQGLNLLEEASNLIQQRVAVETQQSKQ